MRIFTTIFGLLAALVLAFSSINKMMHWPGGSLGLIIATALLIPIYLVLVLITVAMQRKKVLGTLIPIGFFVVIFLIGTLFCLMHWPGGKVLSLFSLLLLIPLVFVFTIVHTSKKPENRVISPDALIMVLMFCSLVLSAMYRSDALGSLNGSILSNENEIAAYKMLTETNHDLRATIESTKAQEAEEIEKAVQEFVIYVGNVKHDIGVEANGGEEFSSYDQISNLDSPDIGSFMMQSQERVSQLTLLYDKAAQLLKKASINASEKKRVEDALKLTIPTFMDNSEGWQDVYFRNKTVISIEATLSALQTKVSLAENIVLRQFQKQ